MRAGRNRARRRRRRPHRGQRRRREQDRNVHRRRARQRARACRSTSPRRSRRSISRRRTAITSPSRSATSAKVSHLGASQLTPVGAHDPQPRLRRDAAPLHRRHHHRARHPASAVLGVADAEPSRTSAVRRKQQAPAIRVAPRDRNFLRRDGGGRDPRPATPRSRGGSVKRRRVADRDPSRVGRSRPGAGIASAPAGHLRRRRARPGATRRSAAAISARSRSPKGPGSSVRCSSACRSPSRRLVPWAPARTRASSRRPHRVARPRARRAARCRRRCSSSRVVTRACTFVRQPGHYQLIGRTTRRCGGRRRMTRWRGCSASGIPAGRSSIDSRSRETIARIALPVARDDARGPQPPGEHRPARAPAADKAERNVDFSFSGIKTAVRLSSNNERRMTGDADTVTETGHGPRTTDLDSRTCRHCASFQRVVVETLLDRTFEIAGWLGARSVGIAGGVSANSRLRVDAAARGAKPDSRSSSRRSRFPPTTPR